MKIVLTIFTSIRMCNLALKIRYQLIVTIEETWRFTLVGCRNCIFTNFIFLFPGNEWDVCYNCVNDFAGAVLDFMRDLYDGAGCMR